MDRSAPPELPSHHTDEVFVRVAVPVPLSGLFDYRWNQSGDPPAPGSRVKIPFGRGSRIGIVVAHANSSTVPRQQIKNVAAALDPDAALGAELLETLLWASAYYQHPIGEVVRHALPALLGKGRPLEAPAEPVWQLTRAGAEVATEQLTKAAPRQAQLLVELARAPGQTSSSIRRGGVPGGTLARLETKGWIEQFGPTGAKESDPDAGPTIPRDARTHPGQLHPPAAPPTNTAKSHSDPAQPELTADQQAVLAAIDAAPRGFECFVLHGVTGSGKSEVFLRLIEKELLADRQTLLLVPEIGLTPQLVDRLRARFGSRFVITHSALADGERLDTWRRARSGEAGVIVGTRSAVFSQLKRPGLFIVDEEHDPSYKQQRHGFCYSARDIAVVRARQLGIPIVLASATPSLESLRNVEENRYRLLELPRRIGSAGHPSVQVVDLNRHANHHDLSTPLLDAIDRHLKLGNQILLFQNRRGFAPVLLCTSCGEVEHCRNCDARLTVHAKAGRLRCHHCGAEHQLHWACRHCGSERIAVGAGTQRVVDELHSLYPDYAVARLDRDATARKGSLDSILNKVRSGETRILVGTQMLTKGHDFPRVTLVGVLNADQGLFGTELRSEERLAQTLIQVAGRAGRSDLPGEVLIQTHYPRHPLLEQLLTKGYKAFAELALERRRDTGWPPYSQTALWRAEAKERDAVFAFLSRVKAAGEARHSRVRLLGPAADPLERKAGRFRGRLLLQCDTRRPLRVLLAELIQAGRAWPESRRVRWSIDVDPMDV